MRIEVQPLLNVLNELIDGSAAEAGWVLNPADLGMLASLDRLSPEAASAVPAGSGASIAAHVDHLRYGLELLNRWSRGEEPFADADYSASWDRISVSETEWTSRREALRTQVNAWREALKHPREMSEAEATGVVASVVHLAYHLGAIRQIDPITRGPRAPD